MFDIQLRPVKDTIFDTICNLVPAFVKPLHLTAFGFVCGLLCCFCIFKKDIAMSLLFWTLNRSFDCLDGALARKRNTASDLGGFLDLLCDFVIYSLLPIAVALGFDDSRSSLMALAFLEASFHINNFVLFYVAAIAEKGKRKEKDSKELTSVMMRPALIEGAESGILFTAMLAYPNYIRVLSLAMAGLVSIGIVQRTYWIVTVLK
ncbi:MAG: hypothetical protein Q9217_000114 [Psora testacea]